MTGIGQLLFDASPTTQAVVPVLIGPLSTFLAILPGLLAALGAGLISMFKPSGMKKLVLFFWHQKVFTGCVAAIVAGLFYGSANNWWRKGPAAAAAKAGQEWPAFRGGLARTGATADSEEPTSSVSIWAAKPRQAYGFRSVEFKTFYSSPTVVGNRVYVSAAEKGPLVDKGAILCLDADSGAVAWSYAPGNFRATFSSPAVAYKRTADGKINEREGYVVCGEGLHFTTDARVTCLNLAGELLWEYRTASHVESSPCIADGRVYIGAGTDGYYCFELEPTAWLDAANKVPKPVWHATGAKYKDCESSPIVADGVFYAGLGIDGQAVIALDAATGKELWRLATEYPVFTGPAVGQRLRLDGDQVVADKLLFVGMGHGDFINTAAKLGKKPIGEVWCINLSSFQPAGKGQKAVPPQVDWKLKLGETVLGGIACVAPDGQPTADGPAEGRIYFGSRDEKFYCVSTSGRNLCEPFHAGSPIITSPAVGKEHVYFATEAGMLHCLTADGLKAVWEASLGPGAMSSPALANGHIYVGTLNDGLLCLGAVAIPTPRWTCGLTGGVADRGPAPDAARYTGRYPRESSEGFVVTAPLMPLADEAASSDAAGPTPLPDKAIYAAAVQDGQSKLVRLRHGALGKPGADPVVWSVPFDRPIRAPLAGLGGQVYVVEGGPSPGDGAEGGGPAVLHALHAVSGGRNWKFEAKAGASGLFGIEADRLCLWSGPDELSCLDLTRQGQAAWSKPGPGGAGIGAPLAADGRLIVATASSLAALAGSDGRVLWQQPLAERPLFGPVRLDGGVLVASTGGLRLHRLVDGEVVWSADHVGRLAHPPVTDGRNVAAINEAGQLFLLNGATGLAWPINDAFKADGRLALAEGADARVVPLLWADRLIYAGQRADSDRPGSELMVLALPPADPADQAVTALRPDEFTFTPRRWCLAGFMGGIRTPMVMLAGRVYFATEKLGLVCLKPNW